MNDRKPRLSDRVEQAARNHSDPREIASVVGAEYGGQQEFIVALIEEVLFLQENPLVDQKLQDVRRPEGIAPTAENGGKEGFHVRVQKSSEGMVLRFNRDGEERKLLFEQDQDDIRIECITKGSPNASLFLREDCTEIHPISGDGGHRYTGDANRVMSGIKRPKDQ